jgi:hypothetical protein
MKEVQQPPAGYDWQDLRVGGEYSAVLHGGACMASYSLGGEDAGAGDEVTCTRKEPSASTSTSNYILIVNITFQLPLLRMSHSSTHHFRMPRRTWTIRAWAWVKSLG